MNSLFGSAATNVRARARAGFTFPPYRAFVAAPFLPAFPGRRRAGREGAFLRRALVVVSSGAAALAVVLSLGCASLRPVEPDPGSVGGVLQDRSRFSGYVEAAFDSLYVANEICPPSLTPAEVEKLVVERLRREDPDEAAIVPTLDAIRSAYPCASPTLGDDLVASNRSIDNIASGSPRRVNGGIAPQEILS